jgi:hypothetical protein
MKKNSVFIFLFIFTAPAFGQKSSMDKAVDSTCKCLEAIKDKIKNSADFDKLGQGCIIKAALPYIEGISKEENIPIKELNEDVGEKLGQKIGMKLISGCPAFMELISLYSNDNKDSDIVTGKSSGVVTNVDISDHVYLNIKESSGKITKVIWVEYFPGSDEYKSNPAALKGKQVEVEWKQTEIYYIAQKDFAIVKQVSKLTVK